MGRKAGTVVSSRFTRIAVKASKASKVFVAGHPEINAAGAAVLVTPAGTIPLRGTMLAITAGHHTSDAFRLGDSGSLFSIAAKDVRTDRLTDKIGGTEGGESLIELFKRNPWNNSLAQKFVEALRES